MTSPDLAIRMQRAAFNRAIADADPAAIAPLLARDAVIVMGTDSAVVTGRNAQLTIWKREFAAPDRTIYTRLPHSVEASPVQPIALEHGHWEGVTASGTTLASGSYCAKWREIAGAWVIEAEIYLTLA